MIKLYNTLTRKLEVFKPQKPEQVTLYTCGPTVYNYYHIGNLRNAVFNDTLRRMLQIANFDVKQVMNITDVGHLSSDEDEGDDKLEKGATREGKTVWEVAQYYTEVFKENMLSLNIMPPNGYHGDVDNYARATDFIDDQIKLIEELFVKNFAYKTKQAIYFDTSKLKDYGKLSGQKLVDKGVGVREEVVTDQDKKQPYDFALWFFLSGRFEHHTMNWPSPWGAGFPGWHLECSAIEHATLGDPVDIHTGGVDHIGTHHTNEIAQTEAAYGNTLANYWLHNEHLLVENKRMSKSSNNFITLKDVTDRGYSPISLRLVYLQAHYRTQQNFSWDVLDAATARLDTYRAFADLRYQVSPEAQKIADDFFSKAQTRLKEALFNDLSTPAALADIDACIDVVFNAGGVNNTHEKDFNIYLQLLDDSLGLKLLSSDDITKSQKELIARRNQARASKKWDISDSIRKDLDLQGLLLKDYENNTIWSRQN